MRTNIYGLPLRSTVRSRRQRVLRTTIGLLLLALLCLIYPGARDLTAQLLGIGTEPAAAEDVGSEAPAAVATKKAPTHGDSPLAADARAAAGLILPALPYEPELVAYVGGEQPFVFDFDDTVSDDFRDVAPASVAAATDGAGRLGGRSRMAAGVGSVGGGFGAGASAEPEATIALRPGVMRPEPGIVSPGVARAGAWTETGWPATMENAVRSGRAAAQALLADVTTKVAA